MSQKLGLFASKEKVEDLVVLKELIEAGKVTPVIGATYPLSELNPELARAIAPEPNVHADCGGLVGAEDLDSVPHEAVVGCLREVDAAIQDLQVVDVEVRLRDQLALPFGAVALVRGDSSRDGGREGGGKVTG